MGTQGLPPVDGSLLWSRASVLIPHPQNSSRPKTSLLKPVPLASGSRAGGRPRLPGAPSALACAPWSEGRGEVTSHPWEGAGAWEDEEWVEGIVYLPHGGTFES